MNKPFKKLTAMKAIRAKCLQCACGQTSEIKECTVTTCAPKPPVNALDITVFRDGTGQIFSIRDKDEDEEENE